MHTILPLMLGTFAAHTYLASFDIANQSATSGVVNVSVSGAALLNAKLPPPGEKRRAVRAFRAMAPVEAKSLSLGRWQVKGDLTMTNPSREEVSPVYEAKDGFILGAYETIFGRTYRYVPKWNGALGGESRPFVGYVNGYFHDSHWRMRKDGALTWRHSLGGRRMTKCKLKVQVSHADSPWAIDVAADGGEWRRLATFPKSDTGVVDVPDGKDIQVRVCGIGDKSFYVWNYSLEATLDGEPCYLVGRTDLRRKDGTLFRWPDAPKKP